MNTKIISRALLALTLCTPLGVWAAGESNAEESCLATFSVSDQTLTIPCVEVVTGTETVLYSARLQQVEEGRFALTQVAELSVAVESDCVASYSLETGELEVPCVEEVNPPEVADMRALVFYAEEPGSPSVFVRLTQDRMERAADKNLSVAFLPQSPPGDWSNTKNCGQTSVLMVMSFYKGVSPTTQGIRDIDDWLYRKYGDPVNSYNGSVTTVDKLLAVAKEKGGFTSSYRTSGWGLTELKQQIDKGYPVITAVVSSYLSNRGYKYAGGHFVVVKGYTSTQLIVNDPGTTGGANKYYSNQEFTNAFNAQGGAAVVVVGGPRLSVVDLWVKSGTPIYAGAKGGFDAQFKLKNLTSQTVVVSKVAMAIHDATGKFVKDMRIDSNVSIASGSFYQMPKTVVDSPSLPGTYQVIAKVSMAKDSLNNDIWEELAKAWFTVK